MAKTFLIICLVLFVLSGVLYLIIKIIEPQAPTSQGKPVQRRAATPSRDDYQYNIKGINYHDVDGLIGDFKGVARALKSNSHDAYAVGIYVSNRRVGFLPRGQRELHARLLARGGSAPAVGYIAIGTDEDSGEQFFYGKVNVLC